MARVMVTGLGLVSSIGSTLDDAATALRRGRSGVRPAPELGEFGLAARVYAPVQGWEPRGINTRDDAHQRPLEEFEKVVVKAHCLPHRCLSLLSKFLGIQAGFAHSFRNGRFLRAL